MPTNVPGPEEPHRSVPAADFLQHALAAAKLCGVTRLADITGLDRLGLPVWQAVRPAARALSVHQGKGLSALAAKVGALCEAIESHCAEEAPADGPLCPFGSVPEAQRAPEIADYCRTRDKLPSLEGPIQWSSAVDLATGAPLFLPHLLVSLDYCRGLPSLFERVSGGLAVGASEAEAVETALLELVERDAAGAWHRLEEAERAATSLDLDSISFPWLLEWRERLGSFAVDLQMFHIPSVVDLPVLKCVIGATEEFGPAYRQFTGTAAHPDPEVALFKALVEAVQSRLTVIAGVRDDISLDYYKRHTRSRRPPDGIPKGTKSWATVHLKGGGVAGIVEQLAALGYPQVAVKSLGQALADVAVVKVFVPGLGSLTRTRREAA